VPHYLPTVTVSAAPLRSTHPEIPPFSENNNPFF
jgi:hypothetical protein